MYKEQLSRKELRHLVTQGNYDTWSGLDLEQGNEFLEKLGGYHNEHLLTTMFIEKRHKDENVKWCAECKAGEHDNYDDDVQLCSGRTDYDLPFRKHLCSSHIDHCLCDGWTIN